MESTCVQSSSGCVSFLFSSICGKNVSTSPHPLGRAVTQNEFGFPSLCTSNEGLAEDLVKRFQQIMLLKVPFHWLPKLGATMQAHPGRHRVHSTSRDFTASVLTGAPPAAVMIFSATGATISFLHLEDKITLTECTLIELCAALTISLQYCACALALQPANAVFGEENSEEGPRRILRKILSQSWVCSVSSAHICSSLFFPSCHCYYHTFCFRHHVK